MTPRHVRFEVHLLSAAVAAVRAMERLLPRVGKRVLLQVGPVVAAVGAQAASEWLLASVRQHVALQVGHVLGGVLAKLTSSEPSGLVSACCSRMVWQVDGQVRMRLMMVRRVKVLPMGLLVLVVWL